MSDSESLETVGDVIKALGGPSSIGRLTGRGVSAVSMWKRRGNFSPETFVVVTQALHTLGKTASPALWKMKEAVSE